MRFAFEEKSVSTALAHAHTIVDNILGLRDGKKVIEHEEVRGMQDAPLDLGLRTGLLIQVRVCVKHASIFVWSLGLFRVYGYAGHCNITNQHIGSQAAYVRHSDWWQQ
jgi:hypothetical protein